MTHKKKWSDMREEDEAKEVSKQPTIMETMERGTKVGPKNDLQKNFDRLLLELIGTNFLAFSFLNKKAQYQDSPYLYRKGMSNYAKDIMSKVIQQLTDLCDVSMAATADNVAHPRLLYLAHFPLCG